MRFLTLSTVIGFERIRVYSRSLPLKAIGAKISSSFIVTMMETILNNEMLLAVIKSEDSFHLKEPSHFPHAHILKSTLQVFDLHLVKIFTQYTPCFTEKKKDFYSKI